MIIAPFRVRLLPRFYLVVALVTGMSTGFGLFYRLLYILAVTVVVNYVWNWLTTRSLEVNVDWRTR